MPRAWSKKDERMYEHVAQSERARGKKAGRAREIASRTVNARRREEGRTESGRKTTSGTGNPNLALEERTVQQLYNRAKQLGIDGRSKMKKSELIRAIRTSS